MVLEPMGLTFDEFRTIEVLQGNKVYMNYEENGFDTPTRKIEIYSEQLKKWGFDPLPEYWQPEEAPLFDPELAMHYPLVCTSAKLRPYVHSGGRTIRKLRGSHPEPLVTINANTAAGLGIKSGDWVYIENNLGRIRQKARLSAKIHPRVVIAEHGWWFPERRDDMHGWLESNLNALSDSNPPYAREMGSVTLKATPCRVVKEFSKGGKV